MINYVLYKSFNLINSVGLKKNVATRLFRIVREYVEDEYVDPDSVRYYCTQFKSRHSEKIPFSTMQNWIDLEYCKQYDDLLVDAIYNAPFDDLYRIKGFGKICEQAIAEIRNRKD